MQYTNDTLQSQQSAICMRLLAALEHLHGALTARAMIFLEAPEIGKKRWHKVDSAGINLQPVMMNM